VRLDDSYDEALGVAATSLSQRYAMDFRRAAERYAALGTPDQVAARIRDFCDAGARHLVIDLVGPYEERPRQIGDFAARVMPLLADLRADNGAGLS
jgi:alkanesulfonate monooxygenase SsuD/methylene tetrahydromethanopterin reductase-like flavin-dependent oxidoreductase (luciferase family)